MSIGIPGPGAAPEIFFPQTDSGDSGLLVDDDASDGWWSGSQLSAIATALAIAGSALAATQAQAVTTIDQGDIYSPRSRGGSGNVQPVFIDADRGKYLQPWVYEQHETVPPRPFEVEGYQPPQPWPATTAPAFVDEDLTVPSPAVPPDTDYVPPLPWPVPPQLLLLYPTDEKITVPQFAGDDGAYQPPQPWGQGYILRPLGGGGARVDLVLVTPLNIGEDEYQPPMPWGDRATFTLWLIDEAPPFAFTEDQYQPPAPWAVRINVPDPWWADEVKGTTVTLGAEPDPWPMPIVWPAPANQLQIWPADERPTPVVPFAVEPDPWPLPSPWLVTPSLTQVWAQDEISSVAALGQDSNALEPVLRAWPYRVATQPVQIEDQRPSPAPIAESMDELFPKVIVERRWIVPQPWEIEQHLLAFLSPHIPVMIRDKSGARYIVGEASAPHYAVEDDSTTRYEVEP